jgi:prolyl-tRNA editing enzyme YbaK/EbsC (Cys-tRNA(Pro) deacylase)
VTPAASPAALRVQAALGERFQVLEFDASTRTAADAAAAIGCTVAEIAKSLIFRGAVSNRPVLVVASGACRVDETKVAAALGETIARADADFVREATGFSIGVAAALGETIARADADFVREATGFSIGGVPPVGHKTPPIALIDESLMAFAEIWAAAGTPNAVFRLTPADLVEMTGGRAVAIQRQ